MIDTRKITKIIMDKSELQEDDLTDALNNLEESFVQENYFSNVDEREIKNINTLLDYYDSLNSNIDKINFYKFALYVLKDETTTKKFFQELKNLSLLTHTGLLDFANDQEQYSKQIMSSFLDKLEHVQKKETKKLINEQINTTEEKINRIKKYKSFFAPIGIVKEVDDAKDFDNYLDTLNLSMKEKINALLMALNFNIALHEDTLSMYELDIQKIEDVINKKILVKSISKIKRCSKKRLNETILKIKKKYKSKKPPKKEEIKIERLSLEPVVDDPSIDKDKKLLQLANKVIKDNPKKDPYELFEKYYDILLSKDEENKSNNIINEAKMYLETNKQLIDNLNEINTTDLNNTLNVYMNNEDLREEVYKTTEKIDTLLTYEINYILNNNQDKNIISQKLAPIIDYINSNKKNNKMK